MLAGYRHVEVSSVSDAIEQLTGQRQYMTHHMQPIFTTKFAGYAVTVKMVKDENHDPNALTPMLAAIDQGAKDSVYVMTVQDGPDIAGMGGLMGTAMSAREFAGAIIDGGLRDVADPRKIGFPASYASGIVRQLRPDTIGLRAQGYQSVRRRSQGQCLFIVAADSDGALLNPGTDPAPGIGTVTATGLQSNSMYAYIEYTKSIEEAVRKFSSIGAGIGLDF